MTLVGPRTLDGRRPQSLRVAIDARIAPRIAGGVAQFILSLIQALDELNDGPEAGCKEA